MQRLPIRTDGCMQAWDFGYEGEGCFDGGNFVLIECAIQKLQAAAFVAFLA